MKRTLKLLVILSAVLLLSACESDKDKEWGFAKIYMPQAILQSGGTNCNFTVKINFDNLLDTSIVVGVYRSGLQELNAFSVDLGINTDTLASAIAIASLPDASNVYDIYKTAQLLPESYYELPEKISAAKGEREASVRLVINKNSLGNDSFFTTSGNYYILPVCINNPSQYELNDDLNLTMFVFEAE